LLIFGLGALSFAIATAGGVIFAKIMNLFLKEKINPLVGAAGVSAVPDSARVVQMVGQEEDPHNFLLMHAMAPNVAGVVGSAVAAGILWSVMVKPNPVRWRRHGTQTSSSIPLVTVQCFPSCT